MDDAPAFEVVTTVETAALKERTRTRIPRWLSSVFVFVPLFTVFLLLTSSGPECGEAGALAVDPLTGEVINCDGSEFTGSEVARGPTIDYVAVGEDVFLNIAGCVGCHGARGEGTPAGPALTTVLRTFPKCPDQITWVTLGSNGWSAEIGATYGESKAVFGFSGAPMPGFGSTLSAEQIQSVAVFERVRLGGAGLDETLTACGLIQEGAEEDGVAPAGPEEAAVTGGGVNADLAVGEEIYFGQGACFACHGPEGEGLGTFPALTGVDGTFPSCADHITWVGLGSDGWNAEMGSTYGAQNKPVFGAGQMPSFGGSLSEDQRASVALFERVRFAGLDLDATIADCRAGS